MPIQVGLQSIQNALGCIAVKVAGMIGNAHRPEIWKHVADPCGLAPAFRASPSKLLGQGLKLGGLDPAASSESLYPGA